MQGEGYHLVGDGEEEEQAICVDPSFLYFKCARWAMGMIYSNSFSIDPKPGPFPPHYSASNTYHDSFTNGEEALVIFMKLFGNQWHTTLDSPPAILLLLLYRLLLRTVVPRLGAAIRRWQAIRRRQSQASSRNAPPPLLSHAS